VLPSLELLELLHADLGVVTDREELDCLVIIRVASKRPKSDSKLNRSLRLEHRSLRIHLEHRQKVSAQGLPFLHHPEYIQLGAEIISDCNLSAGTESHRLTIPEIEELVGD
jgi:hypothetical protein